MSQSRLSLLSLSIAAASVAPVADPAAQSPQSKPPDAVHHTQIAGATASTTKHRRLSSAGRSRRRLSDARDAATRPFPSSLQSASASLAALSLSSPTLSHRAQPIQVSQAAFAKGMFEPEPASVDDIRLSASPSQSHTPLAAHTANGSTRSARKRGTIFTCESCSKVYRHPSCLIKHRWEHTPQWREASKFVLSKHQQVQLLEAAAILSHLSPSSASLPGDRSLWPSFLSGGLVPPPASIQNYDGRPTLTAIATPPLSPPSTFASAYGVHATHPISSSVPASSTMASHHPPSTGPRLHDDAIVMGTDHEGVPMASQTTEDDALNLLALRSGNGVGSWAGPTSVSVPLSHSRPGAHAHSLSLSCLASSSSSPHVSRARERRRSNAYEYGFAHEAWHPGRAAYAAHANGGWSLPRSSVRSKSGSSRSRSGSGSESRSDDEHEDEGMFGGDVTLRVCLEDEMVGRAEVYGPRVGAWKTEDGDGEEMGVVLREDEREYVAESKGVRRAVEQTWDGMEMEMEMD